MPDGYSVQKFRGGFAVVFRDDGGKRHRYQLNAADRPSAEAEARAWWNEGEAGPWTVGRIVSSYIEDRAPEIVSTSRQEEAWKAMQPFWEKVEPELIDKAMCRTYAAQRGVSDWTLRYEFGLLSQALRWAKSRQVIADAPEIWRPPVPERTKRHLTHAEFETFYEHVLAPHARLYVLIGLYTMARPTAILDLTWDRVNFERGTIDFNPKERRQTRKRRPVVPMGEELRAAMETGWEGRTSPYVIERGGEKVASIKKAFQAASKRAGMHVTPYMLRHTGAVWAAEAGVPMAELAQLMGHDDSRTTERHYARFSPGYLTNAANLIRRQK